MLATQEITNNQIGDDAQEEDLFMNRYLETDNDGNILLRLPHLSAHMTERDSVTVIGWDVREGDIVYPDEWMVAFDDDLSLTIPPIGASLRVVKIEATQGQVMHLHDPLIVLEVLEPLPVAA